MTQVYAPASVGNVIVGFDALGAALAPVDGSLLGDIVAVEGAQADEFVCSGPYADKLPSDPEQNLAYMCLAHFRAEVAPAMPPVRLELKKQLPIGSGLGSSACSVVATFAALNEFAGTALDDETLIELMADFEGKVSGGRHYDNITPCFLGGLQLTGELIPGKSLSLPVPDWYFVVAYPGFALNTAKARQVLPENLSLHDGVEFAQRLAAFCALLYRGDEAQALGLLKDEVAEPHRAGLIAGFSEAKAALPELGAQAVGISGAGPTLLAVCTNKQDASRCDTWLKQHYINQQGFSHICRLDSKGTRVLNQGDSNAA